MPLPLPPLALLALRTAGVALSAYALTRMAAPARRDQRVEEALDEMPEGVHLSREDETGDDQVWRAGGKLRRSIRFGLRGVELELAGLGRLRLRRV